MKTLAEHDDVDAIWCFTDEASAAAAKTFSVGNLKQVFTNEGRAIDWFDVKQGEGRWFLDHAVQVKNIWVPYGEGFFASSHSSGAISQNFAIMTISALKSSSESNL